MQNAPKKPVTLVILDGLGIAPDGPTNAVSIAHMPNYDAIGQKYAGGRLITSGPSVGLPDGQMGNSEVGHMTIGAGRIIWMDLEKITRAASSGMLAQNAQLGAFIATLKDTGGTAHLMGLASSGGVHAHQDHILALAQILDKAGIPVALHIFTDGRDVAPKDAQTTLPPFLKNLPKNTQIATLSGRFYAMDRDNRWERIQKTYDAITQAQGMNAPDAMSALEAGYAREETDEFITPTILGSYTGARAGDGILFANFRADRAREILSALGDPDFSGFDRTKIEWAALLGMVDYSNVHDRFMTAIFKKERVQNTLGEVVSRAGLRQFRVAETEKYPHVTFFLNGTEETPNPGEDRHMAPSPKVRTYDLQPEMSAHEVGDNLEKAILGGEYDLIICNFANPDMVGHTGSIEAAKAACEAVDHELGRAVRAIEETGGIMIVTADHGNCETMVDLETGKPHTAHTLNPVRYVIVGHQGAVLPEAILADLAPTLLHFLGLPIPSEMTGQLLVEI